MSIEKYHESRRFETFMVLLSLDLLKKGYTAEYIDGVKRGIRNRKQLRWASGGGGGGIRQSSMEKGLVSEGRVEKVVKKHDSVLWVERTKHCSYEDWWLEADMFVELLMPREIKSMVIQIQVKSSDHYLQRYLFDRVLTGYPPQEKCLELAWLKAAERGIVVLNGQLDQSEIMKDFESQVTRITRVRSC